ncbi:hypothetical protein KY290_028058 [Solanum tuberosum]|uniref:RING-type E3 ubiquitin transferase n=1 Tax=Solanum tuberosum TaxID=4113 RepID=A0ABQ7UGT0_SOLTU|nr:hypothetical protein KY290_028058 [Solanum tuberosum]
MSQYDQVPSFAALLNRLQQLPPVDYSFMSHIKLEHPNIGDIVDEIEEEELSCRMKILWKKTRKRKRKRKSDEIEEEQVVEEDDINEFVDQEMSHEYFERSTCYVTCVMDIDANEDGDDDEEQVACAICLLEYKDKDNIGTLQCGHEFHAECINKWLQRKKSCPFCRASVLPTNT